MNIKNQKVLITGASRGIGLALAKSFAKQGAHLYLTVRKKDLKMEQELKDLGAASVEVLLADFASRAGVDEFCRTITEKKISIDILVNNAGLLTGGLLEEQSLDDIYAMMQVNLVAVTQLCHFFIPQMVRQGRGKIINNASVSGKMFLPTANTYAAAKAGVVALTESLQTELMGSGVSTLLLVTPGVKTDMFDKIPEKYGKNLDLSFLNAMTAEEWAEKVIHAVQSDETHLYPSGLNGLTVSFAHHFPGLFRSFIAKKFHRN